MVVSINTRKLIVAAIISFYNVAGIVSINWQHDVYIVSALPDNNNLLRLHCSSEDGDLGFHDLHVDDRFMFTVKELIGVTKFYCDFWWGTETCNMAVYDRRIQNNHCGHESGDLYICWWVVKADGFYVAKIAYPPKDQLVYMNPWVNRTV